MPSRVHNDGNVACLDPGIASLGTWSLYRDSDLMRSKMWDAPVVIFTQGRMMFTHHPAELKFHEPSEVCSWICVTPLEVSGCWRTFSQKCTPLSSCRRASAWLDAPPSRQHSHLKGFGGWWSRSGCSRWRNRTDRPFLLTGWCLSAGVCLTICVHISCLFHWNGKLLRLKLPNREAVRQVK